MSKEFSPLALTSSTKKFNKDLDIEFQKNKNKSLRPRLNDSQFSSKGAPTLYNADQIPSPSPTVNPK